LPEPELRQALADYYDAFDINWRPDLPETSGRRAGTTDPERLAAIRRRYTELERPGPATDAKRQEPAASP
jgi:hypothetical protein